jgi:hypothetical protein
MLAGWYVLEYLHGPNAVCGREYSRAQHQQLAMMRVQMQRPAFGSFQSQHCQTSPWAQVCRH